jgi:hypothetical protein
MLRLMNGNLKKCKTGVAKRIGFFLFSRLNVLPDNADENCLYAITQLFTLDCPLLSQSTLQHEIDSAKI